MPALYGLDSPPPVTPGAQVVAPVMYLRGGNGDTIMFNQWRSGFAAGAHTSDMFGVDPRNVRRRSGVGHGSRWVSTQRQERTVELVARVKSDSVAEQRARVGRLADILDDVEYGPAVLGVQPPDGGPGAAREIPVHYLSGMEGATDDALWTTFQRIPLQLLAPRPVWRAVKAQTVTWAVDFEKPFLSSNPADEFFPVVLGTGRVLGTVTIHNPGDVSSPALWTVTGAGGPITLQGVILATTLDAGEQRFLDTEAGTILDVDGGNLYEELASAPPAEWPIPPGVSTATVDITAAEPGASVVLSYWPQFKSAW